MNRSRIILETRRLSRAVGGLKLVNEVSVLYQFVVIAMLFATAGLTALVITRLVRARAFSPAQQLLLRPG